MLLTDTEKGRKEGRKDRRGARDEGRKKRRWKERKEGRKNERERKKEGQKSVCTARFQTILLPLSSTRPTALRTARFRRRPVSLPAVTHQAAQSDICSVLPSRSKSSPRYLRFDFPLIRRIVTVCSRTVSRNRKERQKADNGEGGCACVRACLRARATRATKYSFQRFSPQFNSHRLVIFETKRGGRVEPPTDTFCSILHTFA